MSSILNGITVNILTENENRLAQLEMALSQARQATKNIKYDNTVNDIIAEIQSLAQKYGMDAKSVKWAVSDVIEAKNNLESAVYGLEEVFKDAWQNEKWDQEDKEGVAEAPTRVPAVPSKILSATDDGKIITIKVRAPDGSTRSMSNSNPSILQKWLNLKFGLRLPQEISSKFVFEDDVDEAHTNYHANRTGFSRGPRDDERHDLDVAKQQWALKINGKVWSKDGKAVTFDSKEKALKARQSLLAKKPDLEVGLVTRQLEGYRAGAVGGAGLGIEKSPIEKVLEKPFKCSPVDEDSAPELLKKEMPTHRHAEKLLAQNGVTKDDPDYQKHLGNTIKHLRKFGNIDQINKQDVEEEQAPMFTPEEKMVNANDPKSDGWRFYKLRTGNAKESAIMKGLQTEGETGVTRWSKENPPPPELLLNTLIQILMKPENMKSPQDLISLWNDKYGLKHTLNSLKQYAQNDYKKMELSKALQKAALANESFEGK
jgi:hypothetical protein